MLYKKENYRGYDIEIVYDENVENPRLWCNTATFVCEHRRYLLGDEHDVKAATNRLFRKYVEDAEKKIAVLSIGEKLSLIKATGKVVLRFIRMHDHSGITIWLGNTERYEDSQWDSVTLGFAYVEYETAEIEGATQPDDNGDKDWRAWANARMENEMCAYNAYLQGQVFRYILRDSKGACIDSCGGFHSEGVVAEVIQDCKVILDDYIMGLTIKREENLRILEANWNYMIGRMFVSEGMMYRIGADIFGQVFIKSAPIVNEIVQSLEPVKAADLSDHILDVMVSCIPNPKPIIKR